MRSSWGTVTGEINERAENSPNAYFYAPKYIREVHRRLEGLIQRLAGTFI